jgi:Trypsin-like peptidase domain
MVIDRLSGAIVLTTCAFVRVSAQQPSTGSDLGRIVDLLRKATVTIETQGSGQPHAGSGFIVTKDGLIVTAAHVIRGATSGVARLASGESFEIRGFVALDTSRDFAILRVAGFELPTAILANSDSVRVGQRLIAVGAPLGLEATVTDGILSSRRLVNGVQWLQMSVPVSPGSSGGPIANEAGQVVGVVVAGIVGSAAQNLNFALPINYVRGAIALGMSAVPMPLGSTSAAQRPIPVELPGGIDSLPRVVNRPLGIDWKRLDHVALYVECDTITGFPKYRVAYIQSHAIGQSATGRPVLEVHQLQRIFFVARYCPFAQYADAEYETQGLVFLDSSAGFHMVNEFRDLKQHTSLRFELDIRDTLLRFTNGVGVTRAQHVPRGTIPRPFFNLAVAALPEVLPPQAYVWTVDADTAFSRIEPIQVQLGSTGDERLPIPEKGRQCEFGKRATSFTEKRPTRTLRITNGARRWDMTVMASRPHLSVTKGLRCVQLPTD